MNKNNIIILIAAIVLFVAGYVTKSTTQDAPLDSAQIKKLERKAKKEMRKQSPNKNTNEKKQKRQNRKKQKEENKSTREKKPKSKNQTDEEKQLKNKVRRDKKIDKKLIQKTWWNKKGGSKIEGMELSEEVKAIMDEQVKELLKTRKLMGEQLAKLKIDGQQALATGDIAVIERHLKSIGELENLWAIERQSAMLTVIGELSSEQLMALSQAGGGISALDWFDFDLSKGATKPPKKNQKGNNNNKRKKRNQDNNPTP